MMWHRERSEDLIFEIEEEKTFATLADYPFALTLSSEQSLIKKVGKRWLDVAQSNRVFDSVTINLPLMSDGEFWRSCVESFILRMIVHKQPSNSLICDIRYYLSSFGENLDRRRYLWLLRQRFDGETACLIVYETGNSDDEFVDVLCFASVGKDDAQCGEFESRFAKQNRKKTVNWHKPIGVTEDEDASS